MNTTEPDALDRSDPAYAVLHELRRFVAQAQLISTRDRTDTSTLFTFADGAFLKARNTSAIDARMRDFIRRSARLTEALAKGKRLSIGPSGPSVDGIGLERILIAHELASRYREQNEKEWVDGISDWRKDISNILSFFSQMAQRRYEKSTPQMTVAYYPKPARAGLGYGYLGKPLLDEYKALLRLCRDAHTVLVVHQGSMISGLLADFGGRPGDLDAFDIPPIPARLGHFRNLPAEEGSAPIVMNLNTNGSMEILANAELAFRRVNNIWRYANLTGALEAIRTELSMSEDPLLVAHNFLALALDLADRGEGALLFLCDEPTTVVLDSLFDSRDGLIRELPGLPYQELSARTRFTQLVGKQRLSLRRGPYRQLSPLLRDVCSIDGATVFSYCGELLGFGCIVTHASRSDLSQLGTRQEGARAAAAKSISRHGIAIKVSTDGDATLFLKGQEWGTFC